MGSSAAGRKVRLGPIEKDILGRCIPGDWSGARQFMPWCGPYPHTQVNNLVRKGLVVVRWMVMTPEEKAAQDKAREEGFVDVLDHNGGLKLTVLGAELAAPFIAARQIERAREAQRAAEREAKRVAAQEAFEVARAARRAQGIWLESDDDDFIPF